jgi:hypothetical protein
MLEKKVLEKLNECIDAIRKGYFDSVRERTGRCGTGRSFDWPIAEGLKVSVSINVTEIGIHRPNLDQGKDGSGAERRESAEGGPEDAVADRQDAGAEVLGESDAASSGRDQADDVLGSDSAERPEVRTDERHLHSVDSGGE